MMPYIEQGDRALAEGASSDRPPLLDPEMFYFWKKRFEFFVKTKSFPAWEYIAYGGLMKD